MFVHLLEFGSHSSLQYQAIMIRNLSFSKVVFALAFIAIMISLSGLYLEKKYSHLVVKEHLPEVYRCNYEERNRYDFDRHFLQLEVVGCEY